MAKHDNRILKSASISKCGRYRWWLRREWTALGCNKGVCCFVMLNPSTADAMVDDPTIRRCIGFAKSWGYSELLVINLFPWRATDPKQLHKGSECRGGVRGYATLLEAVSADITICAWGDNNTFGRALVFRDIVKRVYLNRAVYCLGLTKRWSRPRHPLYVKADAEPLLFDLETIV